MVKKGKRNLKLVTETDRIRPDGRYKNKNKFCKKHKCKLMDTCWKGKVAAIAYCDEYV